jgi:glycosyltransferase involved in cell wall biosynthesis
VQQISENCTVYSTNSLSRLYYVSGAQRIGKKILKGIEKTQPLLITCQDPFETGLVGKCLANVRKNSELLLQIHTDLFSPYFSKHSFLNRVRLFISKYTLPQADVIRVVSKKIADSLVERGIDEKKIVLKPIEVATTALVQGTPAFDLRQKFPQFKKIILMVSRLESEKNIDMALDAMRIVVSRIPDAGLVIVGSGSKLPLLKKQAYNLKIDSSVAFEGWQTDLIPYYKGCDIFLLTSWFEGYGMVLKEAEAFGCRIVSTNVGIAQEIGASIVEYSPQSIAEKIIEGMN